MKNHFTINLIFLFISSQFFAGGSGGGGGVLPKSISAKVNQSVKDISTLAGGGGGGGTTRSKTTGGALGIKSLENKTDGHEV